MADKVQELRDVLKGKGKKSASAEVIESDLSEPVEGIDSRQLEGDIKNLGTKVEKETGELQEKLKETEGKLKDHHDRYLRLLAEFDNFRKRMEREKSEMIQFANEKLVRDVLPVLDHLELTLHHATLAIDEAEEVTESGIKKSDPFLEGVSMVLKELQGVLTRYGLTPVGEIGERFDPHRYEAVATIEANEEFKPDTVSQVHRKGYLLGERLVRPALVTVAK